MIDDTAIHKKKTEKSAGCCLRVLGVYGLHKDTLVKSCQKHCQFSASIDAKFVSTSPPPPSLNTNSLKSMPPAGTCTIFSTTPVFDPPLYLLFGRRLTAFLSWMLLVPLKPVGVYMHGVSKPALVIETHMDFGCPFSRRMFGCLYNDVMPPLVESGQVDWLFQCVPQPWHPQSPYNHEVALAVRQFDEPKFLPAASALFAAQSRFGDDDTANKTRNQIYDDLVAVVEAAVSGLHVEGVRSRIALKGSGNEGNRVTQVRTSEINTSINGIYFHAAINMS